MIDFETKIFNEVYSVVAPLCASKKFVSTYIVDATAFPAASLIEIDNSTDRRRQSSTPGENFAYIAYQLDVFAQTKKDCRAVFDKADEIMILLGFNRFSTAFITDPNNTKLYRYTARYEAEIDTNGVIYRRR